MFALFPKIVTMILNGMGGLIAKLPPMNGNKNKINYEKVYENDEMTIS